MTTSIQKFQTLLLELFQFDSAELDFGIYRIMNYKRDVVEKFINEQLPQIIERELHRGELLDQNELAGRLQVLADHIKEVLGPDAIDGDGKLVDIYQKSVIGERYQNLFQIMAGVRSRQAIEINVFNHLYDFFNRYCKDGDFVPKRRFSSNQKYAIPYNGEEVYLHWANRDQYFVKTAEHFNDYKFVSHDLSVQFKLKHANVEHNNVNGAKRYFLPLYNEIDWNKETGLLTIPFEFRPLTKHEETSYSKKQEKIIDKALLEIPKALNIDSSAQAFLAIEHHESKSGASISVLEHHLRTFTRRNTSDFFIHKDLKNFLTGELDFYLKNEMLHLDELSVAGEQRSEGWFQELRLIKTIGNQIIDLLCQTEDFQKMLWEKQKFVTETYYCISLATVDPSHYPAIAKNELQWKEWHHLGFISQDSTDLFDLDAATVKSRISFLESHPALLLDTKNFEPEFVDHLLSDLDDLDGITDGLLIHSENWQALRLLKEKYQEKIDCMYIDPPYNTGQENEFLYKDNYQHSSWMTMMHGCLSESRALAAPLSGIFVSTDDGEYANLKYVLDSAWGADNFVADVIWNSRKSVSSDTLISTSTNHTTFFAANRKKLEANKSKFRLPQAGEKFANPDNDPLGPWVLDPMDAPNIRENLTYEIVNPETNEVFLPPTGRCWRFEQWKTEELIDRGKIVFGQNGKSRPMYKRYLSEAKEKGVAPTTLWDDVKTTTEATRLLINMFGDTLSRTTIGMVKPKPNQFIERCVKLLTDWDGTVIDFFAGSGTTGHAVINVNREDGGERKFVLVEMGEYFDTVLIPRLKKVAFATKWKEGRPAASLTPEERRRSPRVIKYIRLESYEDSLNNIIFDQSSRQAALQFEDYTLKYLLSWESRFSETLLNIDKLVTPFHYKLQIHSNGRSAEQTADIQETFNFLLGLHVSTRKVYHDEGRCYLVYRGLVGKRNVVVIWRETKGWTEEDMIRDKEFVLHQQLNDKADEVYVNGESFIPGAIVLEPLFKTRMHALKSGG